MTIARSRLRGMPSRARASCCASNGGVTACDSRCSSPMAMIGMSRATKAAFTLRLIRPSSSPKNRRRSEWPRITYRTPRSRSMSGDTAPVYAPLAPAHASWAARTVRCLVTLPTTARYGNGGAIATSTPETLPSPTAMRRASASAARRDVGFIFQFATTSGFIPSHPDSP